MKTVSTEKAPAAIGPYSQAQIAGGFVFASGQIPIIPETGLLAEGLEAQAHQVFRNITALLTAAGSDISKAVKTTVFINPVFYRPLPRPLLCRGRETAEGRAARMRGHRRAVIISVSLTCFKNLI